MNYKKFQDEKLSTLGMGNMRLPILPGKSESEIDKTQAQRIIDYAIEQGITYFDTAYVYHSGESEKFLGEALVKRHPRENYNIATKFLIFVNEDYKAVYQEQCERLNTDYIDFYLLHGINDQIWQKYIDCGCIEYFLEKKEKGEIRYFGFSSHASPENLEKFAAYREWDFAQIQLNYFDWLYGSAKREYEILAEKNIPIMVMEPCRGGKLASLTPEAEELLKKAHPNWSIASWAFRWVRHLPQVQLVLSGMSSLEQIEDNVATFSDNEPFTDADEEILMKACEIFHEQIQVPCTECRYCCGDCPAKINIPEVMKVYNRFKLQGDWALSGLKDIQTEGRPADCVACGRCKEQCPQGIDIPAIMDELKQKGY